MASRIRVDKKKIADFCGENHIVKLSFFGSILGKNFGSRSDVDVLVEFAPGHVPGLIRFAGMENELSGILGRKADLRTAQDLSRYFREEVVKASKVIHAQS